MHLLLTDRLACPRCGPAFGLILRADRMEDRVCSEGALGCPNCRDLFPIHEGFADLRSPPRRVLGEGRVGDPSARTGEEDEAEALRFAALLGVERGPATVALVGEPARTAGRLAALLPDVEVAAVDPGLVGWPGARGVSRLVSAPGLPFFSSVLRGVVIDGREGMDRIAEAARVVAPRSRVVVAYAPSGTREVLREGGLGVLVEEVGTVVATKG